MKWSKAKKLMRDNAWLERALWRIRRGRNWTTGGFRPSLEEEQRLFRGWLENTVHYIAFRPFSELDLNQGEVFQDIIVDFPQRHVVSYMVALWYCEGWHSSELPSFGTHYFFAGKRIRDYVVPRNAASPQNPPETTTKKKCSFPGCTFDTVAKGLCQGHYLQQRRGESLHPIRRRKSKEEITLVPQGAVSSGRDELRDMIIIAESLIISSKQDGILSASYDIYPMPKDQYVSRDDLRPV